MLHRTARAVRWVLPLLWIVGAWGPVTPAFAQGGAGGKKPALPKFLRLARDEKGKLVSLDTSIVRYTGTHRGRAVSVDLIGAVHVGEPSYYQSLNKEFANYDAVLYELVAPQNTRPVAGQGNKSAVGTIQTGMKNLLGLQFQLDGIDYQPENLVHADMTAEQLFQSMKDKDDGFMSMYLRMLGYSLANNEKQASAQFGLMFAFFQKDRTTALKRALAEQFDNMGGMMDALEGPKGSSLISERNKVALKVLGDRLANGDSTIGIFYGAGHMVDFEKRLVADFKLERKTERWLPAWDLRGPQPQPAEKK